MTIYSIQNLPEAYYVYAYLREDGSYYYIGKGTSKRAWKPHIRSCGANLRPRDYSRIKIIAHQLSEQLATSLEIELISFYGRKDNGTGILRNCTDGGEGLSNPSEETRRKIGVATSQALRGRSRPDISAVLTGKKYGPQSDQHKINSSLARKGQKRTLEQRALMSASKKGKKQPNISLAKTGTIPSAESNEQRRKAMTGLKYPVRECPHCGFIGGGGSMTRRHFDNCLHKH